MKFKKQNAPKQNKYIVIKRMRIKLKKKLKIIWVKLKNICNMIDYLYI